MNKILDLIVALFILLAPFVVLFLCAFSRGASNYICKNSLLKSNWYQLAWWISLLITCVFLLMVAYGLVTDCPGTAGVYVRCSNG